MITPQNMTIHQLFHTINHCQKGLVILSFKDKALSKFNMTVDPVSVVQRGVPDGDAIEQSDERTIDR